MDVLPGVAQSTYRQSYRGQKPTLPLIKYKTLPCMYPPGSTEPCRIIQSSTKTVPLKNVPHPPNHASPLTRRPRSSKRLSVPDTPKNNKVFETKFGPMDMETINQLYNSSRYSTFTQKAGAEYALPVHRMEPPNTTLEQKPDMIRLKGQRYETYPEDWQDAVLWDRIQTRSSKQRPKTPCKEKLLKRRQMCNSRGNSKEPVIRELVKKDGLAGVFVKKCPGYAGYAPLCPPETRLDARKSPTEMTSVMAASYSKIPDHAFNNTIFGRKGVFSNSVTLTYPLNPFNKVGVQISSVDKESRYHELAIMHNH